MNQHFLRSLRFSLFSDRDVIARFYLLLQDILII